MIEAVFPMDERPSPLPLQDYDTRKKLTAAGFDLTKPISWNDKPETNCRRFSQGFKTR